MAGGVLVIGDVASDGPRPSAFEVATLGAELAAALGGPLSGALLGATAEAGELFLAGGFATVYLAEVAGTYGPEASLAAADAVVRVAAPAVVLVAHTRDSAEWAPRLAARHGSAAVTDCLAVRVVDGRAVFERPLYGGAIRGEFVCAGAPAVATVRAGVRERRAVSPNGTLVRVERPQAVPRVSLVSEERRDASAGPSLTEARIIVSGGRGVGGPEEWRKIESLAAYLGAAVGASRIAVDAGWAPATAQVGVTGTTVAPDLYLALGISGALEHLAGIGGAKWIAAVNSDPEANIFRHATFGVVGDLREVLPAFERRLRELDAGPS